MGRKSNYSESYKRDEHTAAWRRRYGKRAGVEGTVSQCVFALRMRRSRYRGLKKTHLQFRLTFAAINLIRVVDWPLTNRNLRPASPGLLSWLLKI